MAKAPHRKIQADDEGRRTVAGKNANGEGSAYFDASKNAWRATYTDPVTLKRRTKLAATKADAIARARAAEEQARAAAPSGVLGANPTIGQLCDWFMTHAVDVAPGTYATYMKHCRRITEGLGTVRILDLNVERVRLFMSELRDADAAPNYIANVRARLRQIVEEAITLGYVDSNVVSKVPAPSRKRERRQRVALAPDAVKKLLAAVVDHELGAAIAIMFLLGNRAGEALGLAWADIDLEGDEPSALVRRASTYVPPVDGRRGGQMLGHTKTAGTEGRLMLPPTVAELLKLRKARQADDRELAGLAWATIDYEGEQLDMVFTDHRGRLVRSNALYDAVKECAETAGMPTKGISTRTGRRSVITALYDAGLDLSDVQRMIGHTDPSTTAGYVQHLNRRPKSTVQFAADLLDPAVVGR